MKSKPSKIIRNTHVDIQELDMQLILNHMAELTVLLSRQPINIAVPANDLSHVVVKKRPKLTLVK